MIAGSNSQAKDMPPRRKRPRAASTSLADVAGETETKENAKHALALVDESRKRPRGGWPAALATRAAVLCKVRKVWNMGRGTRHEREGGEGERGRQREPRAIKEQRCRRGKKTQPPFFLLPRFLTLTPRKQALSSRLLLGAGDEDLMRGGSHAQNLERGAEDQKTAPSSGGSPPPLAFAVAASAAAASAATPVAPLANAPAFRSRNSRRAALLLLPTAGGTASAALIATPSTPSPTAEALHASPPQAAAAKAAAGAATTTTELRPPPPPSLLPAAASLPPISQLPRPRWPTPGGAGRLSRAEALRGGSGVGGSLNAPSAPAPPPPLRSGSAAQQRRLSQGGSPSPPAVAAAPAAPAALAPTPLPAPFTWLAPGSVPPSSFADAAAPPPPRRPPPPPTVDAAAAAEARAKARLLPPPFESSEMRH